MMYASVVLVNLILLTVAGTSFAQFNNRTRRQVINFDTNNGCRTPRNEPGSCVNIKGCPPLLELLKTMRRDPAVVDYLRRSLCGYEGNDPKVCCFQDNGGGGGDNVINPGVSQAASGKFPGPEICGKSDVLHIRVVGGQPAKLGAWPWIAALGYRNTRKPGIEWLCGGALVTDRHVVTAAHCLANLGTRSLFRVRLGDLDLDDNKNDGATPTDLGIERTIVHEQYNAALHTNDVAVIKLQNKVTFTNLIRPICLPFDGQIRSSTLEGFSPFLAGWGALSYRGPSTTALQEVQVTISKLPACVTAYSKVKGATIDERIICAGKTGKDACQGDSGGPLMLPRGQNFYLVGVVSYGYKCADPGYPGIYTRVTQFVDWIASNVN